MIVCANNLSQAQESPPAADQHPVVKSVGFGNVTQLRTNSAPNAMSVSRLVAFNPSTNKIVWKHDELSTGGIANGNFVVLRECGDDDGERDHPDRADHRLAAESDRSGGDPGLLLQGRVTSSGRSRSSSTATPLQLSRGSQRTRRTARSTSFRAMTHDLGERRSGRQRVHAAVEKRIALTQRPPAQAGGRILLHSQLHREAIRDRVGRRSSEPSPKRRRGTPYEPRRAGPASLGACQKVRLLCGRRS